VAAPLVRCPDLAMFDGHPLALTGWLDADQAELTVLYRPEGDGTLRATAYRFCASRAGLEPTGTFACVRAYKPLGFFNLDDPETLWRRDGPLWIAGLLIPPARAKARGFKTRGSSRRSSQPPRMGHLRKARRRRWSIPPLPGGKDGPCGKQPKKRVVLLSRWLQALREAYFALNERGFRGSRRV
jgi:hypothetical protein